MINIETVTTDKQQRIARYVKALGHPVRMDVLELLSNQSCRSSGDLSDELSILLTKL